MAEEIERVHYYQNEYLGAEDFKAEQAYHRDMRRRHNVGHHRWGIVTGLELVQVAKPNGGGAYDVYVYPGLAIDGFGREIVVTERYKLDASYFASFGATNVYSVWIAYRELTDTPPASGYGSCEGGDDNKRVHEEFVPAVDPPPPTHLPIVIDGRTPALRTLATPQADISIFDDESVPYQDFPDAPNARWLVRLGSVQWTVGIGSGHFGQATLEQLAAGRVYTSIVAAEVLAPSDSLTLRQRGPTDPATVDDKDFAAIRGRLQVDGRIVAKKDIFLHGGRVQLQGNGGAENNVPLWIRRIDGLAGGSDLRLHIGPDSGANRHLQRLTIGPGTDEANPTQTTEKSILAVKADDTVDIATGRVFFGTAKRQMLNLQAETYGVGVQNSTLYQRSASDFSWYRGGTHNDDPSLPANGTRVMTLDSANKLTVAGPVSATWLQAGDVYVDGGRVHLRGPGGGIDTDDIGITRHRRGPDQNDLRLIIGDNTGGDDSLTVGPVVTGSFIEQFRVLNNGNVTMKGTLSLDAGQKVNIGSMSLGGGWPVDVVVIRHWIGATNNSATIGPFFFVSRMPAFSSVTAIAALSDVSNDFEANNARWSVSPFNVTKVGVNMVSYQISYTVTDSDGHLNAVSLMFVLVP
jgi:hypothetical protein